MDTGKIHLTKTAEETKNAGKVFAQALIGGDIVALHGELGSGKTTFTQGLAAGLGVKDRIISPTFVVVRSHIFNKNGAKQLFHIDLYRVEKVDDLKEIGIEEMLNDESIVIIEWPEKMEGLLPEKTKHVFFRYKTDTEREITYGRKN